MFYLFHLTEIRNNKYTFPVNIEKREKNIESSLLLRRKRRRRIRRKGRKIRKRRKGRVIRREIRRRRGRFIHESLINQTQQISFVNSFLR